MKAHRQCTKLVRSKQAKSAHGVLRYFSMYLLRIISQVPAMKLFLMVWIVANAQ